jgi:hypothetical protein
LNITLAKTTKYWEGDWELIDGAPYAMSPSPEMTHQFTGGSLFSPTSAFCDGKIKFELYQQEGVKTFLLV